MILIINYPKSVKEVLDDNYKFKKETLELMHYVKHELKIFRGSIEERKQKFLWLLEQLNRIYNKKTKLEFKDVERNDTSVYSFYLPKEDKIVLVGKLSLITFLHEYAHALGKDEYGACKWSINLFKRTFPRLFEKLNQVGHTLVKGELSG